MTRRLALGFLTLAAPLILLAFLSERESTLWLFSFLTMAFPVALVAASVADGERVRILAPYLALLAVVLEGSGFGMLLSSRGGSDAVVLGLPLSAVFMLGGLWLAPLFLVSWVYPRTFTRVVLSRSDLERIRQL